MIATQSGHSLVLSESRNANPTFRGPSISRIRFESPMLVRGQRDSTDTDILKYFECAIDEYIEIEYEWILLQLLAHIMNHGSHRSRIQDVFQMR